MKEQKEKDFKEIDKLMNKGALIIVCFVVVFILGTYFIATI